MPNPAPTPFSYNNSTGREIILKKIDAIIFFCGINKRRKFLNHRERLGI